MLTDDRKHIHELEFSRIFNAWNAKITVEIGHFQDLVINFSAVDYTNIIQCDKVKAPPILTNPSYDDLKMYDDKNGFEDIISLVKFPCHIQSLKKVSLKFFSKFH